MCGIAGILTTSNWADLHDQALAGMQAALRHRGPDDRGLWTAPAAGVGLAHTRLAIIDLSPAGHQPMASLDERYVITFNGEIYNFRELRAELEGKGETFRSNSDTEVLLALYASEGASMVSRLRGMFAFCIWDTHEQTAFLARDPLGIKPLYYSLQQDKLVFASELRALRTSAQVSSELDHCAIVNYLETGSVPEPQTLLRDARCLEAGHCLTWKAGKTVESHYWTLNFQDSAPDPHAAQTTRTALLDSMRAHIVSDVPVGLFLSGGIDSTALLALSSAIGQTDMATFSIGVDDAQLDESAAARRTAAHFGARHYERRLTAESGLALFERYLKQMDQPSIDGLNTFTVSDFARHEGYKVVLSGLGGDEVFGGYPSFQEVPKLVRLGQCIERLPKAPQLLGSLLERHARQPKWRRLGGFLRHQASIASAYRTFRGVFSSTEALQIASSYTSSPVKIAGDLFESAPASSNCLDAVSHLELTRYMRNQLLRDSDVFSMANGLELRVPFVDRVLLETLAKIPANQRVQTGKQLLLDAVPEIPEWVRNHPKRGFTFPFQQWLDQGWGPEFQRASSRITFKNPTWYQRWAVFMLDHWLQQG